MSKLWPVFFLLALGCACAGCYVTRSADGYVDLAPVESVKPLSDAVNSVVEPILGVPIEDVGGVLVDSADEVAKVATDAASGNYTAMVSSIAALFAALAGSVAYRKRKQALKKKKGL